MNRPTLVSLVVLSCAGALLSGAAPGVAEPQDRAQVTESLREAEIAFAASVQQQDIAQFAGFIAEDAVFLGSSVLRGKKEILAAWEVFFAEDGPCLEWHPEIVEMGENGELGMTRGPYTLTVRAADGQASTESGVFTSIWKRQPDGAWQVVFDAGCPPCPEGARQDD